MANGDTLTNKINIDNLSDDELDKLAPSKVKSKTNNDGINSSKTVKHGTKSIQNNSKNDPDLNTPLIDQPSDSNGKIIFFLLALLLISLAAQFGYLSHNQLSQPITLAIMGALAGVGVFCLLAFLFGFLKLTSKKRSDDFSNHLVNGMDSGVLVTDTNNKIIYANRAYGNITGSTSDLDTASIEAVFSKNSSASEVIYRISNKAKSGEPASGEFRLPSGIISSFEGPRWFRIRARNMKSSIDQNGLTVWQLSDITHDRHEQEVAFQELQHAIHYLDHAPAGFFSSEADGTIVYLNSTLADWLGIDLALFKPGTIKLSEFVSDNGIQLINAVKPTDNKSKTAIIDVDFIRGESGRMPVRLYHKVSPDTDGAPGATRTLVINRLAKEETDSALLDAELRFTRFFNNTPISIASISQDGKTVRTNAPFMRMFNEQLGKAGNAEGISLKNLVKESDRENVEKALSAVISGNSEQHEVNVEMAGSDTRYLKLFLSPVIDSEEDTAEGTTTERIVVYVLETTEQKAMEKQFNQGQKMQAVGQLAGGIAHDFNNVLTAIIGFSDLLLSNHRPSDPSFQDIMNIKQNANRAASLVRQLLAFSRRQTLRPQILQMGEVMSDLRMLLDRLLSGKANLNIIHGRDLWPVKADISQLEQVIVNLTVNARDAMEKGGDLTIKTSNLAKEDVKAQFDYKEMPAIDYVLLEVEDQGTGMSPEVIAKIFEPFFSTKDVGKGTGLGLSTVYGIIKQSGGFIYPDSEVGVGTTFRVFLPRHEITDEEKLELSTIVIKKENAKDLTGSATILLVEDEDAVRAFGERALTSRGYEVHEAASGVEALEVLEELGDKIDLIVSDVVMPEMDGPSLLREVRKSHPDLKFIFVSGYAEEAFAKNLPEEERERFGFLAKPFSLKQLATTVKEMLEE
ncbi:MAG: response regulator [Rhizobiales bacterium]|nr:response regulator [Hyphomicrobiales bacterium]